MSKAKLGLGIVGTGEVSTEHIEAAVANPIAEVRAICGSDEERARKRLQEGGAPQHVPFTSKYEDVLEMDGIDAVVLCNRPDLRPEQTIAAAEAGKHILLEKPVALKLEDLWRMQDAVRKNNVKTVVSFVLRWNPLFEIVTALLDDRAIGDIYYSEMDYYHGVGPWYRQYGWNVKKEFGGSSLLSAGIHAVDGIRYFVRKKAVEVKAYSTRNDWGPFRKYEYDPTSTTLLRFEDGTVGKVATSLECTCPYVFRIALFGTEGTILDNRIFSKKLMPGQTDFASIPTILPDSGDVAHHPFEGEMDHFIDCIIQDKESHANLDDAVETHEICFAMEEAAQTGKPVQLPLRE